MRHAILDSMPNTTPIDWTDETLRTLDELARLAFPATSGVTANTLKHRAREDKLVVYRPGKAYLSTLANVRLMLDATRVKAPAKSNRASSDVPNGLGLTESELATMRCERALQELRTQADERTRLRKIERTEQEWLQKYEARKAARKPPRS
ncbi:hypothetical protein ACVIGB_010284 [Bradyrhizobium sp. USDA 4341]